MYNLPESEELQMLYVILLDEIMQSPHEWENLSDQSYLDDRSSMSIQISDLVKKS